MSSFASRGVAAAGAAEGLAQVPVMMSTRPWQPRYSCVPRPVLPKKPTPCESSIMTTAPCWSARSQISFKGRDEPIHRKNAVGRDELNAGTLGFDELRFEIGQVAIVA